MYLSRICCTVPSAIFAFSTSSNAFKSASLSFDIAAGMVDVIFKPVNVNELQNILAKWIPKEKRTSPPEETSAEKNAEKKN